MGLGDNPRMADSTASSTAPSAAMPLALDRTPVVRRRRRRWVWWVVALVLLAAGGAVAMRGRPAEVQASNVQLAYIDGAKIELRSRQTDLFHKYRQRLGQ